MSLYQEHRGPDGLGNLHHPRVKILETLKKNRAAHIAAFTLAVATYRDAVAAVGTRVQTLMMGLTRDNADEIKHEAEVLFDNLAAPTNYARHYDRVIAMLESATDEQVVLSQTQFEELVMDQWSWTSGFNSNVQHTEKLSRRLGG